MSIKATKHYRISWRCNLYTTSKKIPVCSIIDIFRITAVIKNPKNLVLQKFFLYRNILFS
jgi:hypothetical protein